MQTFAEALRETAEKGALPCSAALALAAQHGVDADTVAQAAANEDLRIIHCQLGLFGYQQFGAKRLTPEVSKLPPWLIAKLQESLVDGRLPCIAVWELADRYGLPRLAISAAAELLDLRVSRCQLGCF